MRFYFQPIAILFTILLCVHSSIIQSRQKSPRHIPIEASTSSSSTSTRRADFYVSPIREYSTHGKSRKYVDTLRSMLTFVVEPTSTLQQSYLGVSVASTAAYTPIASPTGAYLGTSTTKATDRCEGSSSSTKSTHTSSVSRTSTTSLLYGGYSISTSSPLYADVTGIPPPLYPASTCACSPTQAPAGSIPPIVVTSYSTVVITSVSISTLIITVTKYNIG